MSDEAVCRTAPATPGLLIRKRNYYEVTHANTDRLKLDQETWLCRTHLDTFWVDFGPYWTNLDIFGPFCLL